MYIAPNKVCIAIFLMNERKVSLVHQRIIKHRCVSIV